MIAESFERIHRANLVGMGVLPLEFPPDSNAQSLGLTGREVFDIEGIEAAISNGGKVRVRAVAEDGTVREFEAKARVDTPQEAEYFRHGGILPYVVRQLREKA